ncbi:wimple/ift172, putative [Perkinsus marinus ATCC 50983]|uniref:Wimple/ift172, putative n=1 Tax=Perkinsus marinus (strain ATCC 50983 / TXsc) TaxID=423536 RepID=C5L599_PERM5|nr:wimple/ift172, putative [Perkinsus marinus ATCC 50983]EER08158.1 wimple/ift172, putative [Perkinsus marinus ATCC 50983]|eukprot:XP_002776342.1 wimple/ift172, putative [Perkinsus marinus ATCC 50983]
MAFLFDANTIRVNDVRQAKALATIDHDCKIDWLSLNPGTAHRLLFRDKRHRLYLYDLQKHERLALLSDCNYVNWVPDSDVVVAQSRDELCVWYSIATPDRITKHAIKGDIEDIIRANGRTVVVVDESPNNQVEYELDEALINFSASVERGHFAMAVDVLEYLPLGPETTGMWRQLGLVALNALCLPVAERCYAVLGEVEMSRELRKIQRLARSCAGDVKDIDSGLHHPTVMAAIAVMKKQFSIAEEVYIEHGHLEDAIRMYQSIHKYDEAIRLAEHHCYPDVMRLKTEYLQWLLQTHQEDLAGDLQEREGNYEKAIALFLKSGMAARAASVVAKHSQMNYSQELLQKIASSLKAVGCDGKAGELYEKMGMLQPAMDSYRRGHAYHRAIELATKHGQFAAVPMLHEEWGNHLMDNRQYEKAIEHFSQAKKPLKAVDAAVQGRQWPRAEHLLGVFEASAPDASVIPELRVLQEKLGDHFSSTRQHQKAERCFLSAGAVHKCVQMYITAQEHEQASKIAKAHMSQKDRIELYTGLAEKFENEGNTSQAEELYIVANEYDLAIEMYRKNEDYVNMIRLIRKHRPEILDDTYRTLGEQFESKGNFSKAEKYFCEGSGTMWESAVSMYRRNGRWEDAKRVSKACGGKSAFEKVVIEHAQASCRDSMTAARMIASTGLIDAAIDHSIGLEDYSGAMTIAEEFGGQHRIPDIHLKRAMHFEDIGRFADAEAEFLLASKPKEAIEMYTHQKDWPAALRVAEISNDKDSTTSILEASARDLIDQGRLGEAENALIEAGKPQVIVEVYLAHDMHQEAVRVCRSHCPNLLSEVMKYSSSADTMSSSQQASPQRPRLPAGSSARDLVAHAKLLEEAGEYSKAIDAYLEVSNADLSAEQIENVLVDSAVRVATHFLAQRYTEVANKAAKRLESLGRFGIAAELYESTDRIREAVDCLVKADEWERAIELTKQKLPSITASIEEQHRAALVKSGKTDQLAGRGDTVHALDAYARSNEWMKCLNLAETSAPQHLQHYVLQYVKVLISEDKSNEACNTLLRYGPYNDPESMQIYRVMASRLISNYTPVALEKDYETDILHLRNLLLKVLSGHDSSSPRSPSALMKAATRDDANDLVEYLIVAHLIWIGSVCRNNAIDGSIICKAAVSLCRYCNLVPVDRVFYNAGFECKRCGDISMAFFFLNRYLDLVDAIRDPDSATIDNSDFLDTDIPSPYDINLPHAVHGDDHLVEEARDWVCKEARTRKQGDV